MDSIYMPASLRMKKLRDIFISPAAEPRIKPRKIPPMVICMVSFNPRINMGMVSITTLGSN